MRYKPIDPKLFIKNRKKLISHLYPKSLAVWHSNDVLPKNTDGIMPFVQQNDLFYLTGINQEDTILLICPDAPKNEWQEILFIKETNPLVTIWEGSKYTQQQAREISGIETIYWLDQFHTIFHILMASMEHIYLNTNEHLKANFLIETKNQRFINWAKSHYPLHHYQRLAPIMNTLRTIKEQEEITLIQQACYITQKGFQAALTTICPGVMEYEIEAQFACEFIKRGANYFAFSPIIASGANSCILHYIHNHDVCKDGDLLLMDVGAEYANYASDVTRVVPINGKFSHRQRQVYNAVLRILNHAQKLIQPGLSFEKYNQEVACLAEKELLALKLITMHDIKNQSKDQPAYKKYFMHGISHHLGLSTHDLGDIYGTILPNMVITVEPGIYIVEEALGIRLENTIVVTENGIKNLTENIPIEPDAIEALMYHNLHT